MSLLNIRSPATLLSFSAVAVTPRPSKASTNSLSNSEPSSSGIRRGKWTIPDTPQHLLLTYPSSHRRPHHQTPPGRKSPWWAPALLWAAPAHLPTASLAPTSPDASDQDLLHLHSRQHFIIVTLTLAWHVGQVDLNIDAFVPKLIIQHAVVNKHESAPWTRSVETESPGPPGATGPGTRQTASHSEPPPSCQTRSCPPPPPSAALHAASPPWAPVRQTETRREKGTARSTRRSETHLRRRAPALPTWDSVEFLIISPLVFLNPGSPSAITSIVFFPINSRASSPPVITVLPWDESLCFQTLCHTHGWYIFKLNSSAYEKVFKVDQFSGYLLSSVAELAVTHDSEPFCFHLRGQKALLLTVLWTTLVSEVSIPIAPPTAAEPSVAAVSASLEQVSPAEQTRGALQSSPGMERFTDSRCESPATHPALSALAQLVQTVRWGWGSPAWSRPSLSPGWGLGLRG